MIVCTEWLERDKHDQIFWVDAHDHWYAEASCLGQYWEIGNAEQIRISISPCSTKGFMMMRFLGGHEMRFADSSEHIVVPLALTHLIQKATGLQRMSGRCFWIMIEAID